MQDRLPRFNTLLLITKNVHTNKVQHKQSLSKFFIFINIYALYNNAKRNIKFHSSLKLIEARLLNVSLKPVLTLKNGFMVSLIWSNNSGIPWIF